MSSQTMVAKKCAHLQLQLKATLNYTDGKLNIYVKIVFYYAIILGWSKAKKYISKLFLSAVKLVIRR